MHSKTSTMFNLKCELFYFFLSENRFNTAKIGDSWKRVSKNLQKNVLPNIFKSRRYFFQFMSTSVFDWKFVLFVWSLFCLWLLKLVILGNVKEKIHKKMCCLRIFKIAAKKCSQLMVGWFIYIAKVIFKFVFTKLRPNHCYCARVPWHLAIFYILVRLSCHFLSNYLPCTVSKPVHKLYSKFLFSSAHFISYYFL